MVTYNPRSFDGGVLKGNNIVRFVYIDEAGISNFAHEPHLVIAAVLINPDTQWRDIEAYYADLSDELFGEEQHRFVFHAKDIWHGAKTFPRESWSKAERLKILSRLVQVPRLFNLRLAISAIDRTETSKEISLQFPNATSQRVQQISFCYAFVRAIEDVNAEIERNAPGESAMLIVEDSPKMKGFLKFFHEAYTNTRHRAPDAFQADRIVDTPLFAKKSESMLLQIADHCAFIVNASSWIAEIFLHCLLN